MSSAPSELAGSADDVIGPFRVLAPFSRGGMARVDLAQPTAGGPICVLKQLHASLQSDDDAARRFAREAQLVAMLDHPNIARRVGSGRVDDRLYIATELVRGVTFERINRHLWSQGRRLPVDMAVALILDALRGLEAAHALRDAEGREVGVVHRDLSTKNLMLDVEGQVKIIDFGVAKGAVDDHRTATGMLMGTPLYMSPEQAAGRRVDRRSDLYTLGVVLWELLAGRRLVSAKEPAQMLMAVSRDAAPDVAGVRPEVPPALAAAVRRALEKDPAHRFASAAAFREAIEAASRRFAPADAARRAAWLREQLPEDLDELERRLAALRAAAPRPDRSDPDAAEPTVWQAARSRPPGSTPAEPSSSRRSALTWSVGAAAVIAIVGAGWLVAPASPVSTPTAAPRPRAVEPAAVDPQPRARAAAPSPPVGSAAEGASGPAPETRADPPTPPELRRAPARPRPPPAPSAASRVAPASRSRSARVDRSAMTRPVDPGPSGAGPAEAEAAPLRALLARYRATGQVQLATELYGQLRARARAAEPAEKACLRSLFGALDLVKYDDVDATAPVFAEAVDCLRRGR